MQSVERVPANPESGLWSRLPAHTLFGALGVGVIALVLSHPAVMSMAGLDIARQRPRAQRLDAMPVGTIAMATKRDSATAPHATVRGLIGLRAAIREQR
ncbi:MAG: hypothetical protein KDJ20_11555 [Hyphomicrobiales bacterium]|nr:hypothetical protein [Rhodoblastus sp.]MCC2100628.1 hypothetical protein [Hyphomicrobiales bacterium]MCC2104605.1 hypothetical protein [Hyphomicrobiales bacterium]MCO5087522.1 hypothetical protein [Methylobacteriaceae bacterium]HPG01947.1 hypothetical protein [Rhodoblastus sp.]